MYESIKRPLLHLLRVPHDPDAPAGSADSVRVFRASPRLYHWNIFYWAVLQFLAGFASAAFLVGFAVGSAKFPPWLRQTAYVFLSVFAVLFLVQLLITFWKQKLDYEMRWYIVTDRSLRIRSGVWSVQEITMTFANIQKVQLSQGPLQKILNIATVEVSSAGGGAVAQGGEHPQVDRHAARFEGVGNAAEIRDFILDRLRRYRDAGLGETASVIEDHTVDTEAEAANAVLEAARGLRLALER